MTTLTLQHRWKASSANSRMNSCPSFPLLPSFSVCVRRRSNYLVRSYRDIAQHKKRADWQPSFPSRLLTPNTTFHDQLTTFCTSPRMYHMHACPCTLCELDWEWGLDVLDLPTFSGCRLADAGRGLPLMHFGRHLLPRYVSQDSSLCLFWNACWRCLTGRATYTAWAWARRCLVVFLASSVAPSHTVLISSCLSVLSVLLLCPSCLTSP